jgi:hypothetical protein
MKLSHTSLATCIGCLVLTIASPIIAATQAQKGRYIGQQVPKLGDSTIGCSDRSTTERAMSLAAQRDEEANTTFLMNAIKRGECAFLSEGSTPYIDDINDGRWITVCLRPSGKTDCLWTAAEPDWLP